MLVMIICLSFDKIQRSKTFVVSDNVKCVAAKFSHFLT